MEKLVALAKRKPGMSFEDFRTYYEEHHAPLTLSYFGQFMASYRRNYVKEERGLHAEGQGNAGGAGEPEFSYDVITEICFATREDRERHFARLAELKAMFAEDEARFMDRGSARIFWVEEMG